MTGHHDDPEALKALSIELVSVSIFKFLYKWGNRNNLFHNTASNKYGSRYHWLL